MRGLLRSLLPSIYTIVPSKTHHLFCKFSSSSKPLQQPGYKRPLDSGKRFLHADQKPQSLYAHIHSLCQQGLLQPALLSLADLSSPASHNVYLSLLKACHKKKNLPSTLRLLTHLLLHGLELAGFLGEHAVIALVRCGALDDALHIFCRLPSRTAFSWTAIISGFTNCGHNHEALHLYVRMENDKVEPDPYTFVSLFKACGYTNNLEVGRSLHALARKKGFASDTHAVTTMISMYGKCGSIKEAENVLLGTACIDVILWNALLSAYVEVGQAKKALQYYAQMQIEGLNPDKQTFVIALQACGSLAGKEDGGDLLDGVHTTKVVFFEIGQALHADARCKGFLLDISVSTTLVSMYGKCGASQQAENAFQDLGALDVVPCTAMLSAYVDGGEKEKALNLYRQMEMEGRTPCEQTVVCALQACAILVNKDGIISPPNERSLKESSLEIIKAIHCDALRRDHVSNVFVSNALISVYGKCGGIEEAENVFTGLLYRDVVSWTSLLSNYAELGYGQKALQLYREMHVEGVSPNHLTFCIALQACIILFEEGSTSYLTDEQSAKLIPLELVRALHMDAERRGVVSEVLLATTLVTAYGKCGSVVEAEEVFRTWQGTSIVFRNAMLSGFVNHGQGSKALEMYECMWIQKDGPDLCSLICILQACRDIGTMDMTQKLHFDILSASLELETFLASALIHAYGRNASMVDAEATADKLPQPDIVSWNACISGHAGEGNCSSCLQMFGETQQAGFQPNEVSFTSLLSACSHAGLIAEGMRCFDFMSGHCHFSPELTHYVKIVDLLGRAGDFKRVSNLLQKPTLQADAEIWASLLGACCTHGNIELGLLAFHNIMDLQPQHEAAYVFMSNIYAEWQAAGT